MSLKNTGEILKSARESIGISIENVSKKLKIHEKYIRAFEDNDNSVFDSKVIPRGFLIKYCNLLGLDSDKVVAYWRRDFVLAKKPTIKKTPYFNFILTPKILAFSFFGLLVFSIFIFFIFQYIKFKSPPKLEILSLTQDQVIFSESVLVEGYVDKNASVYVNEKEIKIDTEGKFAQKVFLQNGENTITLKSISPLGSENRKTYLVKAQYDVKKTSENTVSDKVLKVKCISQNPVFYEIKNNETVLFNGFALGGVEKVFYGDNLYIYTDSIESLEIFYMNQPLEEIKDKYGKFSKNF
ncbi:helix-turn-helix domain-containing protein [Patescibacteria group bacterium]|nr:helix-turn-helix domain-containing protein [Patescibacteria group bacterium]